MSQSQSTIYPTSATLITASEEDPVRVSVGNDTLRYGTTADALNSTILAGQSELFTSSKWIQVDGNGSVLVKRFEPWAVFEESDVDETIEGGVTFAGDVDFTDATVIGLSDANLVAHEADTTNIHGITDTARLTADNAAETVSGAWSFTGALDLSAATVTPPASLATQTELDNHISDTSNVHGITDTTILETTTGAQTKVDNHNAATTSVHGISNTAVLETTSGSQTKVDTHAADTTSVHGITDTTVLATDAEVTTAVSDHSADTTSVHGIADTSVLVVTSDARFTTVTPATKTASYTLVLTDAGKAIDFDSASNLVLTVPPNSSVAFTTGTVIEVARLGTGKVEIDGDVGVTVNADTGLFIADRYTTASLRKTATDTWLLVGNLSAT